MSQAGEYRRPYLWDEVKKEGQFPESRGVMPGFPGGSAGKESACNVGDLGSIPGLGRSPAGGHGNPLQDSCLENPHGQRSLEGCSWWGRRESDMTEHTGVSMLALHWSGPVSTLRSSEMRKLWIRTRQTNRKQVSAAQVQGPEREASEQRRQDTEVVHPWAGQKKGNSEADWLGVWD